jgi:hypothetical protein
MNTTNRALIINIQSSVEDSLDSGHFVPPYRPDKASEIQGEPFALAREQHRSLRVSYSQTNYQPSVSQSSL